MSVLVKGMEMPNTCEKCNLESFCDRWIDARKMCGEWKPGVKATIRHPECPLIEIPPHGRLIDADEISEHKYTTIPPHRKKYADGKPKSDEEIIAFKFGWNYAIDAIVENAPTIIPAEEGE